MTRRIGSDQGHFDPDGSSAERWPCLSVIRTHMLASKVVGHHQATLQSTIALEIPSTASRR